MQNPSYEYIHDGLGDPEEVTPGKSFGAALSAVACIGVALANFTAQATSKYSKRGAFHPLIAVLAPQASPETLFLLRQQASERAGHS
jgi:hypothetical protein